jgi:ABC-2 type transport system ATP-binding protein
VIVAEQLTRKYGSRLAVDRVSFHVPKGEVVGFLGPNGAGKSTTLKMVSGYLPPTSGSVTVAGFDVVEASIEARKKLGYMPEAVPIYPELRVEEYLHFRAELKGVGRAKRKSAVHDAMEKARVTDVARQLVGELSKGYKQRVGLADALVASPELLILDEPTAGLDPNQILQVRELIKELGKAHTVLLSTHILPEVEAVCTRVVIITRGKVVAEGTTDEIRARMSASARDALVQVRGPLAKVERVVNAQSGMKVRGSPVRIEGAEDEGENAVHRFELELDDAGGRAANTAEALTASVVKAGLGMRGLELRGKSLEAIFHEVTTKEDLAKGDGDAKNAGDGEAASKKTDSDEGAAT